MLQVGVPEASFDFWAAKVGNQVLVLEFLTNRDCRDIVPGKGDEWFIYYLDYN
jgi:hypothetical protein